MRQAILTRLPRSLARIERGWRRAYEFYKIANAMQKLGRSHEISALADQVVELLRGTTEGEFILVGLTPVLAASGASAQAEAIVKRLTGGTKAGRLSASISAILKRGETREGAGVTSGAGSSGALASRRAIELAARISRPSTTLGRGIPSVSNSLSPRLRRPGSKLKSCFMRRMAMRKPARRKLPMQALKHALEIVRVNRPDFAEWAAIKIALSGARD